MHMQLKKTQPKNRRNKIVIGIIMSIVFAAGLYTVIAWSNQLPPFISPTSDETNLSKTNTEKRAIDDLKKNPENKVKNDQHDVPDAPAVDESGLREANALVTNVETSPSEVRVSGFISDIVEDGGTCYFVFVQSGKTIEKAASTLANATSTTCRTLTISKSEFDTPGRWLVHIKYTSQYSRAESLPKEFIL